MNIIKQSFLIKRRKGPFWLHHKKYIIFTNWTEAQIECTVKTISHSLIPINTSKDRNIKLFVFGYIKIAIPEFRQTYYRLKIRIPLVHRSLIYDHNYDKSFLSSKLSWFSWQTLDQNRRIEWTGLNPSVLYFL